MTVGIALRVESLEETSVIEKMRTGRFLDFNLTYLCKLVLLLRQEVNIPEEERVVLQAGMISREMAGSLGEQHKPCIIVARSP